MIDFSQYPAMSVISVECVDGDQGFVVRQKCSSHSPYILVREGGWVARVDKHGKILSSFDDPGFPVDHYHATRIIAVLGTASTTVIREKDEGNDELRFAVYDAEAGFTARNHSLDSAVCLAEKIVETGRAQTVHIFKAVKVVSAKTVAVVEDYEPEVK